LTDDVSVVGKIEASGSVQLVDSVRVEGKVDSSGSVDLKNGVDVTGDVSASSKVRVEGPGLVKVGGSVVTRIGFVVDGDATICKNLNVRGSLSVNGRLHVKGNVSVYGSVTIGKCSEFIVDGKRTIHGSLQEV
jgi:cytoskeletal protein CcmA (bactofilin family)